MIQSWRFLLDQNVRIEVKTELLNLKLNTIHTSDVKLSRALDPEILDYAIFGNHKLFPLPKHHPGIIRLKILPPTPQAIIQSLESFIKTHKPEDIQNALVIITQKKVRIRRIN